MGEGDRASKYTVMNKALCEYVRLSFISNLFLHKNLYKKQVFRGTTGRQRTNCYEGLINAWTDRLTFPGSS